MKALAAIGALMWLIPIVIVLAVLFGVILWAGFGWYGIAGFASLVWLAVARFRRR